MFAFLTRDQHIVFVFPLLPGAVAERRHAVAVLPVGEPFPFVAEAVGSLADAETGSLVVLPFAHISFGYTRVQVLILEKKIT